MIGISLFSPVKSPSTHIMSKARGDFHITEDHCRESSAVLTYTTLHDTNIIISFRSLGRIVPVLRTGSRVAFNPDILHIDEGTSRREDSRLADEIQDKRGSSSGGHPDLEHRSAYHRRRRSRV